MRRRLRDVGSKITGALTAVRDEGPGSEPALDAATTAGPGGATAPGQEPAPVAGQPASTPSPLPSSPDAAADPPGATEESHAVIAPLAPKDVPAPAAFELSASVAPPTGDLPAPTPDPACIAAVQLAQAAAIEVAGESVGEYVGVEVDEALVVTHGFATTEKAYRGWHWAVTVTRADGSDEVTVDEVVLLPGGGALVSPHWVPWADRVRPGDLSPGDLLPTMPGDPRLVPSFADPDALDDWSDLIWELGLGRVRVLSLDGRADAAERWSAGEAGPATAMAKAAPGRCGDCGFLVPLAGSLRALFGACANAFAPDDGRVVALDHGCGAHSEAVADAASEAWTGMAVEHDELELVPRGDDDAHSPGTVEDTDPTEPFGHS